MRRGAGENFVIRWNSDRDSIIYNAQTLSIHISIMYRIVELIPTKVTAIRPEIHF